MKTYIYLFAIIFIISSCGGEQLSPNAQTVGNDIDLSIYEKRDVPGSDWVHVSRNHPNNELYEEGYVFNGKKTGTWISYYPDDGYIQSISNYHNGVLMGPYMEFDERGRLNKHISYENNVLTGQYAEYQNGRPERKIQYKNGLLNGYVREYNSKSQLIKESNYKDNVLDGKVSHFNEEGKVVLEYIYKNGEKISGGIIE